MKNKITTLLLVKIFFTSMVLAQSWTGPGAANFTQEIFRSGKVGIGNYPSTFLPATDLELHSFSPALRLGAFHNGAGPHYHTNKIEFGSYGAGTTFSSAFSMGYSVFPSCGSGIFSLSNGVAGGYIGIMGSTIGFGISPVACSNSWMVGNYLFNGSIGTKSILVGADYNLSLPPYTAPSIPAGYIFSVKGKSEFKDHVIIGTLASFTNGIPAGYKLYVKDGILTEKVKIALSNTAQWADYVFDKNYNLRSLADVESYIKENNHLPDVPSAEEAVECGVDLAEMDATLLRKVEELTLYMIEMKKEIEILKKENGELKSKISN